MDELTPVRTVTTRKISFPAALLGMVIAALVGGALVVGAGAGGAGCAHAASNMHAMIGNTTRGADVIRIVSFLPARQRAAWYSPGKA